jgi:hypothetical protein
MAGTTLAGLERLDVVLLEAQDGLPDAGINLAGNTACRRSFWIVAQCPLRG